MEKKLCFCKTCGKISIDTRDNSKSFDFTPIEGETEIITDKDMVNETIYLCPQCKDENFSPIKNADDLVSLRANYITKETKRKQDDAKEHKLRKELSEDENNFINFGFYKDKKVKSPFSQS